MNVLTFLLVSWASLATEAATSTKIRYLPNGQIAGYELIINDTERPQLIRPIYHPTKIVKQTSHVAATSGRSYTLVDEREVEGRVYLNVQSVFAKPPEVKKKYPVNSVLTVPSVQYKNGVPEEVELTLAQIGPYAALLVPIKSGTEARNIGAAGETVPPEVRDSVKSFIRFSEPQTTAATDVSQPRSRPPGFGSLASTNKTLYGPYEPPKEQGLPRMNVIAPSAENRPAPDLNRTFQGGQDTIYASEKSAGLDRGFVIKVAQEDPTNAKKTGLKGFLQFLLPETEKAGRERQLESFKNTVENTTEGPEQTYPYEGHAAIQSPLLPSTINSELSGGVKAEKQSLGSEIEDFSSQGRGTAAVAPPQPVAADAGANNEAIHTTPVQTFSNLQAIPTSTILVSPSIVKIAQYDPSQGDQVSKNGPTTNYFIPFPIDFGNLSGTWNSTQVQGGRVYPTGPHTGKLIETLNGIINRPENQYVPIAGR